MCATAPAAAAQHRTHHAADTVLRLGYVYTVDRHDSVAHAAALVACNLDYAQLTVTQFQQRIQACLDKTKDKEPNGWLKVSGWNRGGMQPAGTELTKADLDALHTQRPIAVGSTDGHTVLANSRALQVAGITAATPDPEAGRIDRGPDGQPTGILEDRAGDLVQSKIPPPTSADELASARPSLDAMAK